MSVQLVDASGKDDLKTQFVTREGEYRLMTLSEYSRPNRVGYQNNQSNPQVRVSLITLPSQVAQQAQGSSSHSGSSNLSSTQPGSSSSVMCSNGLEQNAINGISPNCTPPIGGDRICFNYGKELYVYAYRGVKKASDLSKPIDKKLYKGTNPSCHDFNASAATFEGAPLLVGFSTGQIQLVYPGRREQGKLYNEERLIDKTRVTCLKWIPGSENQFLASHASGCLYMYNEELSCSPIAPSYQPHKCGDGFIVLSCKSKSTRNPLYKWCFGQQENASINEFCFSPCGQHLAVVSQDGFLRVFHYNNQELVGIARSYFGGFLCVCWSPDGKYVVVGGEDDLVTVYSLYEQRVVARGQGHRSWVSVVAFDPYTTSYSNWDGGDFSDDDNPINDGYKNCYTHINHTSSEATATAVRRPPSTCRNSISASDKLATSYRLGSVSQDTQLCLWDITEDVLRQSIGRLSRNLSSADPAFCTAKSECSSSANNSNNSKQQVVSTKDTAKTANVVSTNDNDTVDNANFNLKNLTLIGNSSSTGINCDDSNNSNNSSGKGSTNSVDGKHSKKYAAKTNSVLSSVKVSSTTGSVNKKEREVNIEKNAKLDANHHHNHSTFNSITQRLSSFSFGNSGNNSSNNSDKSEKSEKSGKITASKRNIISLTGKSNSNNIHNSANNNHFRPSNTLNNTSHVNNNIEQPISTSSSSSGGGTGGGISNTISSIMTSSLTKNKRIDGTGTSGSGSSIVSSYDPMKLIGTPACPRFDDCPVLEPLVCKKIAHERLTALIFREDCFLTACQDGFVYTWARPGYINLTQHLPPSPTAPSGGTVV
ncbi:WD repeat-containing protein 20 [Toxorhynchites rutilus septentrionalis]|uniref:WD repeat-containing protein 20 n=1 Tax=Toxorhynchites rutilus septentrionalis TaxID=329112 RepID=UPI00247A4DB8|nr:WD repeat-containing protein 20 [Toxorhynchites rutilus septentrionalis]